MELRKAIMERRSVRRYKQDPIPQPVLDEILKAGTYAPTGRNGQSPIILAVTNKEVRDRLSALNAKAAGMEPGGDPFYGAPVVLVVLADRQYANVYVNDGSLVLGNMMLAAYDLGVGSCWIHRAKETFQTEEGQALLKELGIQGDYEGVGNCILGYSDEPPREAAPRKENYIYYVK